MGKPKKKITKKCNSFDAPDFEVPIELEAYNEGYNQACDDWEDHSSECQMQTRVLRVQKTIEELIKSADKRFQDSVKYSNYSAMATLDSYKNGLEQALEVVKLSEQSA